MKASPSASPRLLVISLITVITAAALAGCTPGPTNQASPKVSPTASSETAPEKSAGITSITDTPGSGEDLVGAIADSKVSACSLADGAWKVSGTVTNPTDERASYRIYVSLLDGAGDTRALQQVDVDRVKSTATSDWTTSIPQSEDGLNCVLRVERYAS